MKGCVQGLNRPGGKRNVRRGMGAAMGNETRGYDGGLQVLVDLAGGKGMGETGGMYVRGHEGGTQGSGDPGANARSRWRAEGGGR